MAKSMKKIRKVEISRAVDFDDQLWTVNVAVLIFAGFLAGTIIAKSDFDTPKLLYNGWSHLTLVVLLTLSAFLAVWKLQGKIRRRVLLCVVISLLAHTVLVTRMVDQYMVYLARMEEDADAATIEDHELNVIPDHDWHQFDRPKPRQSFQEPIETEAPKPTDPEAIKQRADEPDLPVEIEPIKDPEPPVRQQPNPTIQRRDDLSVPRRAETSAGLSISRQPLKSQALPNQSIPEPELRTQPRRADAPPRTDVAPQQRETADVRINQQRAVEELPASRRQPDRTEIARIAPPRDPIPERPSTPKPMRRTSSAVEIPQSPTPSEQPRHIAQPTRPAELPRAPDHPSSRRRADAPNSVGQLAQPEPMPTTPHAATSSATRPRTSEQTPRDTQTAQRTPTRRALAVVLPSDAPSPQEVAAGSAASPSTVDPAQLANPRRAERASGPSSMPVEQDRAVGASMPAMAELARLPSNMAPRRSAASQQMTPDVAATPARPRSLASRTNSGAPLPSTEIADQPSPTATPAPSGGSQASRLTNVGPTRAIRRAGAQPSSPSRSEAAGAAENAIGSAQTVARAGQPRARGSDRDSAAATDSAPRLARGTAAAESTSASSMPQASSPTDGSIASQAHGPSVPSFNLRASATRRGGTTEPLASQETHGAGSAGSSGTSGAVSVTATSRAARFKSMASAESGGGTPKPARTTGGAASPSASAEGPTIVVSAPSGRNAAGDQPLVAQVGGARRQSAGMPGSQQSQSMAGSVESSSVDGEPLSTSAARRRMASGIRPGGSDLAADRSVTIRRSNTGADLPATSMPVENAPSPGAGGVTVAAGGLPSSMTPGDSASVRQAAANLMAGETTSAANMGEPGLGSSLMVAVAGQARAGESDSAMPGASGSSAPIRRSTAGPLALADSSEPMTSGPSGGTPASSGSADGPSNAAAAALQAGTTDGPRREAGMAGGSVELTSVETAMATGPAGATPGTLAGPRRTASGDVPGPSMAAEIGRGPTRSTDVPGLPVAISEIDEPQPITTAGPSGTGNTLHMAAGIGSGPPSRQGAGPTVQIVAAPGPGGLSFDPSRAVGMDSRRARRDSEVIHSVPRRFVVPKSGGLLAIDSRFTEGPVDAYRQRDPGRRADAARSTGGNEGTERAVEMGLDFFARTQFPDGHWSLHKLPVEAGFDDPEGLGTMSSDTAATGLALLSFLGAGNTHEKGKYRGAVRHAVDWLVRNQKENGDLYTGGSQATWFYSHGIAAIALCEAYGMTGDPDLREPAQKAIDFLVNTQDPQRGGWRYTLNPSGVSWETDTSVTGWQLMAMKSAQIAGLDVPEETLEKIAGWLDTAEAPSAMGQYIYNPNADDTAEQREGRLASKVMTAEAMLMRMYLGQATDDPQLIAGADHLMENLPAVGTESRSLRDCYYWYYATQAMFHLQGDHWTAWHDRLRPILVGGQEQSGSTAGSWHPKRPVRDKWGTAGGRHYVTAMNVLMLEVHYRYLPLFKELGQ